MEKFCEYLLISFCLLVIAITFNVFFNAYDMVISGSGGVSIIIKNLFDIPPAISILILQIIAFIFGVVFLGLEMMKKSILATVLYPIFVSQTEIVNNYVTKIGSDDFLVFIVFGALIVGTMTAVIYKRGYFLGGVDVFIRIISKYTGKTIGQSGFILNGAIILTGGFFLGFEKILFAVLIVYISTYLHDEIMLGSGANKLIMIHTDKMTDVKKFMDSIGVTGTVVKSTGCYTNENSEILMCYLTNTFYFKLKEGVRKIDKHAFMVVTNAYSYHEGEI